MCWFFFLNLDNLFTKSRDKEPVGQTSERAAEHHGDDKLIH